MEFTDDEKRLWNEAIKFARQNKKAIGRKLTSLDLYPAEDEPVSVFMSGSPGAGKTEASIALLNLFTSSSILRIDPDELRAEFDLYTGGNAYLFQGGISILISKIIDLALSQQQSFLLDGTLAKIDIARSNVERSWRKDATFKCCMSIKTRCLPGSSSRLESRQRAGVSSLTISSSNTSPHVTS